MKREREHRQQRKGLSAFAARGLPSESQLLPAHTGMSSDSYATGYKRAAETLIAALKTEANNLDSLVHPIMFLYRHYLELMLKSILEIGVRAGMTKITEDRLTKHNLHKLWVTTKNLIKETWPDEKSDDVNAIEKVILEFHRHDEAGMSFRYKNDLSGTPLLQHFPQWVSLTQLKTAMHMLCLNPPNNSRP